MASAARPDSGGLLTSDADAFLGSYDGEYRTVCVWDGDTLLTLSDVPAD